MKYIVDTNALLSNPSIADKYDIIITSHVLRELEDLELKRRSDRQLQYEIRAVKRNLENVDYEVFDLKDYKFTLNQEFSEQYVDNILIQIAYDNNYGIITNDRLIHMKCKQYNIECIKPENNSFISHKGFKTIFLSQEGLNEIYQNLHKNDYNLLINEYLIIYDDSHIDDLVTLDIFKWNGVMLESLKNKRGRVDLSFKTTQFDAFTPKDAYQSIAVDSIFSNQVTQIRGRAGSGKSMIALETSWHLIERGEKSNGYDRLVIFVNPTPTRDSQELGFYSGDKLEKLLQSSVGAMLISKFGDEIEIRKQISYGRLDILPFVDLRGYETGGRKTIVWILEAQNLTDDLIKLGMQRLTENAKLIIDGDYDAQVDKDVYSTNNGMKRVSEVFRGEDIYGEIELQNIYRSQIAIIADRI